MIDLLKEIHMFVGMMSKVINEFFGIESPHCILVVFVALIEGFSVIKRTTNARLQGSSIVMNIIIVILTSFIFLILTIGSQFEYSFYYFLGLIIAPPLFAKIHRYIVSR